MTHSIRTTLTFVAALITPILLGAQTQSANWPVYQGSEDHTHYTTLSQISPANVSKLKVAWTFETHDEFKDSEMQANPVVIDGVLYATTPKQLSLQTLRTRPENRETDQYVWRQRLGGSARWTWSSGSGTLRQREHAWRCL